MTLLPLLTLALLLQTAPKATDRAASYGLFLEALAARDSGKPDEALKVLQKTLKADPGAADAQAEIARIQLDEGRFDLAIAAVEQAVKMAPQRADLRSLAGQVHQFHAQSGGGEPELRIAAREYETASQLSPGDPGPLRDLTRVYSALRDVKAALGVWKRLSVADPQNLDAFVQLATLSLALGDSKGAIEALETAAAADPANTRVRQLLGDISRQTDKPDEALKHYALAAAIEPKDLVTRLKMGEILVETHRGKEALAMAQEMLGQDGRNRFALDLKARALKELGRIDEALEIAQQLSSSEPKDLKSAFLVVTLLEQKGALTQAEEKLSELTRRNTAGEDAESVARNNRVFLAHAGMVQQRQGKYKEAAASFGEAVAVGKEPDAALVTYRIDALISAKDFPTALKEARAARGDPTFKDETDLKFLEAYAIRGTGDEKGATAMVENLVEAARTQEVLAAADFFQRGKNLARARELFARVAESDAKSLRAVFGLASVLERQKKFDEADAAFRKALALAPDSAITLNYLGYMNAERNVKVDEALSFIQKALSTDPDNGSYLDSLAWAFYRLGRHAEAETAIRRAIPSQENNAVVVSHLGFILAARGQTSDAVKYLRLSLTGEDEDGELDRVRVENKLRELSRAETKKP